MPRLFEAFAGKFASAFIWPMHDKSINDSLSVGVAKISSDSETISEGPSYPSMESFLSGQMFEVVAIENIGLVHPSLIKDRMNLYISLYISSLRTTNHTDSATWSLLATEQSEITWGNSLKDSQLHSTIHERIPTYDTSTEDCDPPSP